MNESLTSNLFKTSLKSSLLGWFHIHLRPNIDGLIFRVGNLSGTFLPSVWEQLPKAKDFLSHLKNKAGLPQDYWSNQVEIFRYETEMFGED